MEKLPMTTAAFNLEKRKAIEGGRREKRIKKEVGEKRA
jgi:hypothetical protein